MSNATKPEADTRRDTLPEPLAERLAVGENLEARLIECTLEARAAESDAGEPADGSIGVIVGYAAVFDSWSEPIGYWDPFIERIAKGAFDAVLRSKPDVCCLFNHKSEMLLGRTAAGSVRLSVDDRGLRYECDVPDTSLGRDIMALVKRGDLNKSSFVFRVKSHEWTEIQDGPDMRTITEIDLLIDVSPVTWPAYEQTEVAARSREAHRAAHAPPATPSDPESVQRRRGIDETVERIDQEITETEVELSELGA